MVWHIFKKDFRLLWPLSLTVVLVGALYAVVTLIEGHFPQPLLVRLTAFLPILLYLGVAIVAVTVVHQDRLPESQEDWLVRPLSRRDLALAKVLFVLLTVNVPLLIIDVLQQLALHFPLSVSIGVAASHAWMTVFAFSLPALTLGALTRSLVNAFFLGAVSAIGFVLLLYIGYLTGGIGLNASPETGWISLWLGGIVIVIGSAATLTVQYSSRRTPMARAIGVVAILAALSTVILLPSSVALAIQDSLWGTPNSGGIRLSFDPGNQQVRDGQQSGPGNRNGPPASPKTTPTMATQVASSDGHIEKIRLPLTISGMHPGAVLVADRIEVRLVTANGAILYDGSGVCTQTTGGIGILCSNDSMQLWANSAGGKDVRNEEELSLPMGLYQRIKNEPVRVEVSYALTRLVARSTQMIKATGGLKALPEMGSCATRIDGDGDEVELSCLTDTGVPDCAGVLLEDPQTGRRNPEFRMCLPQYGPFRRAWIRQAVERAQLSIPFRDLSGLAHYPVGSAAIEHSRIDVTVYDPVTHFRTRLTVPSVRLADWARPHGESTAPVRN